jgi:hypothetical protein
MYYKQLQEDEAHDTVDVTYHHIKSFLADFGDTLAPKTSNLY